jgi:hypothetical protein
VIGRITRVRKRDGRLVDFDETKIADAIHKASCAVGRDDRFLAEELAGVVTLFLEKRFTGTVPGIEEIQDMVEKVLIETGHAKMAKAYILYRERRARAREHVSVHGGGQGGPLVGNPGKARVSPWSKARIAEALVREADLDEKVATQVAASVEAKVFARGVKRLTTSVIRALVEAELFERGYPDRVGRQALVGLPRYDIERLLRGGKESPWRAAGPQDLKRTVADAVLGQYALSEIYSAEVVDAHLDLRLHILDAQSPFEWLGAAAPPSGPSDGEAWVEDLAARVGPLSAVVTRDLTMSGAIPDKCSWALAPGAAGAAARRLLGHGALRGLDPRGGRFRLALAFPALPADEGALLLAESLVREHWARFRAGSLDGLPELVPHAPSARIEDPSSRRTLLPLVAAAAETGRLLLVIDRGEPLLVTPWYRLAAPEPPQGNAAIPVAGAAALNVAALPGDTEAGLVEALEPAITLAIKALKQKRSFLSALAADPSGPLYRVSAGARPLVGTNGSDLVHLVGVREAAHRLEPEPAGATRLAGRLRSYAAVRIAEEGRSVRLRAVAAPDRDGEASERFFHGAPTEGDLEPFALPAAVRFPGAEPLFEAITGTLVLRFPREQAPPPESLYDAVLLIARDPRVGAIRFAPWPDRSVRALRADS